jgi:hypothetical protein
MEKKLSTLWFQPSPFCRQLAYTEVNAVIAEEKGVLEINKTTSEKRGPLQIYSLCGLLPLVRLFTVR